MSPAAKDSDHEPRQQPDADRSVCTPCRGTGQLISNLGGEPHQITCPWCGGSGQFDLGRDAQQFPAEHGK